MLGDNMVAMLTADGIDSVLAHTNPSSKFAEARIKMLTSIVEMANGAVPFYSEDKDGIGYVLAAKKGMFGDDNVFGVMSFKETMDGSFRLHDITGFAEKENTDGTKAAGNVSPLNYSTGVVNARSVAQGLLNRQWGSQNEFKEWLRERRENVRKSLVLGERGAASIKQLLTCFIFFEVPEEAVRSRLKSRRGQVRPRAALG